MEHFDRIIVGDGIAACCLLYELKKRDDKSLTLQIAAPRLAKPCTQYSTSIVSLFGIEKNISPLGDLLFDAYHWTSKFFEAEKPDGVSKGCLFQVFPTDEDKQAQFIKRFGYPKQFKNSNFKLPNGGVNEECYFVEPNLLLGWLKERGIENLNFMDGLIINQEKRNNKIVLELLGGQIISATQIIYCTGGSGEFFFTNGPKGKVVPGSYLRFVDYNGGDNSWALSQNGMNLIYRSTSKELLFGGTAQKDQIQLPYNDELKKFYHAFSGHVELPKFETAEVLVGMRHKGKKRMPFWGEVDKGIYAFHSLYKNGFTLGPYGASKLSLVI